MISFKLGRYIVAIQPAVYVWPVYQKVESGSYTSAESIASDVAQGENVSTITHRLLIPVAKVSVVRRTSDADLIPEMFQDKT